MNENLPPRVLMKLMKEVRTLCKKPPSGIKVSIHEDDITNIVAVIDGPEGTPFEGGAFECKLVLGQDFPTVPPKGVFNTKIFHPNVSKSGEICVNTLKKDWNASLGISHVLTVIRCLLIYPNAESALNEDAGKLLLESYDEFESRARLMTSIHAKPKKTLCTDDDSTTTKSLTKKPKDKKKAAKKKKALKRL